MATPFENWFSSDWRKMLQDVPDDREVLSNGFSINTASWDRRAAYLHWVALGRPMAAWQTIYPIAVDPNRLAPDPTFRAVDQDDDDLLAGSAPAPAYDDEDLLS